MDEPLNQSERRRPRLRRLAVLVALAVVLVSVVAAYRHYWLARPIGEGPAGPPVPHEPFAKAWTTRPVLLLAVGDSVTAGLGARLGYGYVDRLVRNPPDEFPDMQGRSLSAVLPNLTVKNIALSGSNSLQHVEMLEELEPQDPETLGLVMMTSGGNDLIHWYGQRPPREGAMYGASLAEARPWIDNYAARLETMLDLVDARFPGGCHVFLADIYDPTDGVGDARNAGLPPWPDGVAILAAYNETIRQTAKSRPNVHLVPMYDEFIGHGVHCRQFWREFYRPEDPYYWFYVNLEDPNERGYDAIRRVFLLEILKIRDKL
ncbi:MAG: SGNH/GDSL hydrolase family protein [Thermoguttaceae bacterium]|nr:SGNH/GDSL hydrolase family protein [Thermoguttaceae bacterium]